MWTTAHIRRHIAGLAKDEPFATRDMLNYGSRSAVDEALYRMVKTGELVRLARGVFVKAIIGLKLPSVAQVAAVKARAFGKLLFTHGADAAKSLDLIPDGNRQPTFVITGSSTSFRCGSTTVHFKGKCARQTMLGNDAVGIVVRALWFLGRLKATWPVVSAAMQGLGRVERQKLRQCGGILPAWLFARVRS